MATSVGSQSDRAVHADDARIARALRELMRRHRKSLQIAITDAGVSRRMFRRVLRGQSGAVPMDTVRSIFESFGARARLTVYWNGAELDRLIDQDHAALVERVVSVLRGLGWTVLTEVTFSEFGERGSIDALAWHEKARIVLVVEVKASWGSVEGTNRSLDAKVRLAPKIGQDRFGITPTAVGRLLVFPDESTHRRVAERHAATLATVYPARGRDVRRWLRRPAGPFAGLWFLSFRSHPAGDDHDSSVNAAARRND
jgi:hypothetical protein